MNKLVKSRYCLVLVLITILAPLLYGCARKEQPQRKPAANGGGQEVRIAVSLADMERDGNQIIKKVMSARQGQGGGQQGQQGQQGGGQQGGGQQANQGGPEAIAVQGGGQEGGGQQGQQGGQQGQQGGQQGGRQGRQRVNITWLDAKNDPAQQEKDLDQLINQKVSAVVLQAVDPSEGPRLVRKLAQANIKVIALENLPANSPLDGYIASDHARAGELQARYLLGLARERSSPVKAVVLQGDRNDQASREIAAAVLESLKGQQGVQVAQVKDHPRGDPQMAASTVEQLLAANGSQIDAVVCTDSRMSAAVADLLKSRGLGQRVVTLGVGADQKSSRALAAGDHDAEVDVSPDLIAQYAFDAAVGLATTGYWQYDKQVRNGDFDVPAKITPVRLLTRNEAYLLEQRWNRLAGQEGQQGQQQGQQGQQQGQQGQQGQQQGQQGQQSQQGQQGQQGGQKTTLRITTQDGKTMEVQINGEIKKIETVDGGGGGQAGGGGGGNSGGGGR